jgi:spermidine synthase
VFRRRTAALEPLDYAVAASGAAGMGLEILAGRMLAPAFGSSVYTWGSVIGVFLAALALGYTVGGRRAPRRASRARVAALLAYAALLVGVLPVAGPPVVETVTAAPLPARVAPVVPAVVLFALPTVLLGAVSPHAAELAGTDSYGVASGRVYALGTAGSIAGAFGAAFALVPALGVVGSEAVVAVLLLAAAGGVVPGADVRGWSRIVAASVVLVAGTAVGAYGGGAAVVHETSTPYQELSVVDDRGVRTLYLDGTRHSATYLDGRSGYVFEYPRYFHLPMLMQDDVDRVLFIGGGGFSGPQRFVREYPNVTVDAVELDPEVVSAAKQYFGLSESPRLNVHVADGREFLESTNRTYDVIVLDAYRKDRVPFHLTTVEFMRLARSHLDDDGTLVANVISASSGSGSEFYRAEYRTMQRAFPHVYAFPTMDAAVVQNIELVATKRGDRVSRADLQRLNRQRDVGLDLRGEIDQYRGPGDVNTTGVPVLRDDHAGVTDLLDGQVGREYVVARNGSNATQRLQRGDERSFPGANRRHVGRAVGGVPRSSFDRSTATSTAHAGLVPFWYLNVSTRPIDRSVEGRLGVMRR